MPHVNTALCHAPITDVQNLLLDLEELTVLERWFQHLLIVVISAVSAMSGTSVI